MTLDKLINEQLSLGKKLGEFKVQYQGRYICHTFTPYYKCQSGNWHGLDQNQEYDCYNLRDKDWHLYTEPKQKKKYWLWNIKLNQGEWVRCSSYLNENGLTTKGYKKFLNWQNLEKRKVEDSLLEIEVDSE